MHGRSAVFAPQTSCLATGQSASGFSTRVFEPSASFFPVGKIFSQDKINTLLVLVEILLLNRLIQRIPRILGYHDVVYERDNPIVVI